MLEYLQAWLDHLHVAHRVQPKELVLFGSAIVAVAGVLIRAVSGDRNENDNLSKLGWLLALVGTATFIYEIVRR